MQFQDIVNWMLELSRAYGYFGIFLLSAVGAASVFIPIPYTVVIFTLGGLKTGGEWAFDPLLIAVAAGIGSAIGEFSSYLIGLGGRKVIGEKHRKRMDVLVKVFNRYGSIVIFIFALTPLPDDLIFIPLGVMRYSLIRALIPALVGKVCMNFIVAYSGRFSVEAVRSIFGVDSDWISALIGMSLAIILLIIVLVAMFKLDWETYLERYMARGQKTIENRKEDNHD